MGIQCMCIHGIHQCMVLMDMVLLLQDLLVILTRALSSSGHQSHSTHMVMLIIDLLMEWWLYITLALIMRIDIDCESTFLFFVLKPLAAQELFI